MQHINRQQSYKYNFMLHTRETTIYGTRLEFIQRGDIGNCYNVYIGNFLTAIVFCNAVITAQRFIDL
jgi:hypothetical protein